MPNYNNILIRLAKKFQQNGVTLNKIASSKYLELENSITKFVTDLLKGQT